MSVPQEEDKKQSPKNINLFIGILATMGIVLFGGVGLFIHSLTPKTTTVPVQQSTQSINQTSPAYGEDYDNTKFHGYDCTSDCSGHQAGWDWAEKYEICSLEYDNGKSQSFDEGVWAWAEENCTQEDMDNYTGPE